MNAIRRFKNENNLVRRGPAGTLATLRDEMDHLFEHYFGQPLGLLRSDGSADGGDWMPALDVTESDTEITVRAELAGVDPKNLDIRLAGNVLTLSGEKHESRDEKRESCVYMERRYGSFRRSMQLPTEVDANSVTAEHANGVVTIHLKKRPGAEPKRIQVKPSCGQ